MNISLREIDYLLSVAELHSITRAAEKMNISQPSLSQAIKKLESEIGYPLFVRKNNPIKLTEIGKRVIKAGLEIKQTIRNMENDIAQLNNKDSGNLILGMPLHLGSYMFPLLTKKFQQKYPFIHLQLVESSSLQLEEMVAKGTLDLAMVPLPIMNESLHMLPFLHSRLMLLCSKDNPLVREGVWEKGEEHPYIDLKKAKDTPFILGHPNQRMRIVLTKVFEKAGFQPSIAFCTRSNTTIKKAVAGSDAVGILPELYIEPCPKDLFCFYLSPQQSYPWTIGAIYCNALSPLAKKCISLIKAMFLENNPSYY